MMGVFKQVEINKEDCAYFNWILIQQGCCGRHNNKIKKHGNCKAPGNSRKMCNTAMPYCQYKRKEEADVYTKEL